MVSNDDSDEDMFQFDLMEPNTEIGVQRKRKESLSSPGKLNTPKRQCTRGCCDDYIDVETDTFDFQLSPLKRKEKHDQKSVEETTDIHVHTNKRPLPLDAEVEKREADLQKKIKQSKQNKQI